MIPLIPAKISDQAPQDSRKRQRFSIFVKGLILKLRAKTGTVLRLRKRNLCESEKLLDAILKISEEVSNYSRSWDSESPDSPPRERFTSPSWVKVFRNPAGIFFCFPRSRGLRGSESFFCLSYQERGMCRHMPPREIVF